MKSTHNIIFSPYHIAHSLHVYLPKVCAKLYALDHSPWHRLLSTFPASMKNEEKYDVKVSIKSWWNQNIISYLALITSHIRFMYIYQRSVQKLFRMKIIVNYFTQGSTAKVGFNIVSTSSSHRVFYGAFWLFFLKNEAHILKKITKVATSIESNSRTKSGASVEQ